MLPSSYEFHVDNQSGGSLTDITFTITPWKFDSNGALEYGTPIVRNGSMADATAGIIGTAIDNSSDKYLGAHVLIEFTGGSTGLALAYFVGTGATERTHILASATAPDGKDYHVEI